MDDEVSLVPVRNFLAKLIFFLAFMGTLETDATVPTNFERSSSTFRSVG